MPWIVEVLAVPIVSQQQRRWLWANDPAMARRWEEHTPQGQKLPARAPKKKRATWDLSLLPQPGQGASALDDLYRPQAPVAPPPPQAPPPAAPAPAPAAAAPPPPGPEPSQALENPDAAFVRLLEAALAAEQLKPAATAGASALGLGSTRPLEPKLQTLPNPIARSLAPRLPDPIGRQALNYKGKALSPQPTLKLAGPWRALVGR